MQTCSFAHTYPILLDSQPNNLTTNQSSVKRNQGEYTSPIPSIEKPKIALRIAEKTEMRTAFVKQGMRPEEKAIFELNRKEWERFPNYLDYLKLIKDEQEQDIAQVIRRYQYSFTRGINPTEGIISFSIKHTYYTNY